MLILTREEFINRFSDLPEESAAGQHWNPEQVSKYLVRYRWFIEISPISHTINTQKSEYLNWCQSSLTGCALCFSGGAGGEWWGFTEYEDIILWTLRWC